MTVRIVYAQWTGYRFLRIKINFSTNRKRFCSGHVTTVIGQLIWDGLKKHNTDDRWKSGELCDENRKIVSLSIFQVPWSLDLESLL